MKAEQVTDEMYDPAKSALYHPASLGGGIRACIAAAINVAPDDLLRALAAERGYVMVPELAARDAEIARLRQALLFYAEKGHFMLSDESAWDTVSGEPQNLWCDEAGTATVEDGAIARAALNDVNGSGRD